MITSAGSARGQETRQRIVDVALELFREHGYDGTTMRAIAKEARVSLGNAYYYFASKDDLVLGFYDQLQTAHESLAETVLAQETELEARLRGVVRAWVDEAEPYKDFAGKFFRNASDPSSPLSPFSKESSPVRDSAIALYGRVLDGTKVSPLVKDDLPELLWLYAMGIVLYWVHDASPRTAKTYTLIERSVPLVVKLVNLSRYRLLRSAVEDVKRLLTDVKQ
ncbi:MAG: transcriptional regulator, TetR family [Frankiales bacterium]|nr:transcriptional regulator, TetR family [Frankiales bacterium]